MSTGMVVLIVAGDRTTPAAQADCTTIVERLRKVEWSEDVPPIHIVPDADTGRWLLRSIARAMGDEAPARDDPTHAGAPVASSADRPADGWPLVERRRRTSDRRQARLPDETPYDRRADVRAVPEAGNPRASNSTASCTEREEQIVQLIREGLTNKEIAQRLGIVEDTVKKHLQHIYDKLGVRRRTLVMLSRRGALNAHAAATS